jgi:MATE family multidrug resistance protein
MRSFELPRRDDLTAMLRLAVPVVVVQVGLMLMGVVDTMVVGRLSAKALAAVALGNLTLMAVTAFGRGILMAMDPLVSQARGAGDDTAVRRAVQRGLLLAVLVCIPTVALLAATGPVLTLLRQPPEAVPLAAGYVIRCLPGLLPFFWFVVLRQTLQALERLRPIVITIIAANLLNVVLDVGMVHGRFGFPAWGTFGSAWATTISRTMLFVLIVLAARRDLVPLLSRTDRETFQWTPMKKIAALGSPIGVQIQIELTAFSVIALLMGGFGMIPVAAHQVAINLAALTFMVPLGVSAAAAVRVGHAVGRGDDSGVRRASSSALLCGGGFMVLTALLFLGLPRSLALAYTSDAEVIAVAAALIPIAGVFQVFDGLQIVASGALRGLGDTRIPMLINLLGFWLVGMPVSLGLGFGLGWGPRGLWWGFVFGLTAVALLLMVRAAVRLSRPMERVRID